MITIEANINNYYSYEIDIDIDIDININTMFYKNATNQINTYSFLFGNALKPTIAIHIGGQYKIEVI